MKQNTSLVLSALVFVAGIISPLSVAQANLTDSIDPKLIQQLVTPSQEKRSSPKTNLTHEKLGPFLLPIIQRQKASIPHKITPMVNIKEGERVQVYVSLKSVDAKGLDLLKQGGLSIEVVNTDLNKVQGWVNIDSLEILAGQSNVIKLRVPSYGTPAAGSVTTQGDAILRASELRAQGASGQGVKIGVISDGANDWRTAANSGDLPQNITTFGSCATRADDPQNCRPRLTCNEGTAMAEIIHDIAPDAEIAVAAVSTSLEFIQQLNRLANTFEADIIVDDLGFFGEPYFEDGDLARAVSALPSDILYFSSAGNSANTHYEREYSALTSSFHNFGVQNGTDDESIGFSIRPNRGAFVLLQWNDRYENANSDYDLFVFDQDNVVAQSAGSGSTAIEGVCVFNESTSDAVRFAFVDKFSGSNRRLEMFFLGASAIEYPTPAGSVFGHAGTPRAIAVGAINAGSSSTAFYSSHGPSRIDFPSFQLRAKPDISATDGVSVSGAGGFSSPFFGTSAAAPHAAAIAAQLLSASPDATPQSVRASLLNTASGGGSRAAAGNGRIDAVRAFEQQNINLSIDGLIPNNLNNRSSTIAPTIILLLEDD